jgi:predicted Fe-Mo cluster-binding NifX family protein
MTIEGDVTLKIAIANDDGQVSQHFGHCAEYTFFEVEDGRVVSQTSVPTPPHEPGILPPFLAKHGANCVIAGGMGSRAQELFAQHGIDVIIGVGGPVQAVLEAYIAGELVSGESTCSH